MTNKLHTNRRMTVEDPYTRAWCYGPMVLTDAELLAIILRTGHGAQDAVALSKGLLEAYDNQLGKLLSSDITELMEFPGIGRVKALELLAVMELSKRIACEKRVGYMRMDCPGSIADYYMEQLRHASNEQLLVCLFDSGAHLICDTILSSGTVRSTSISPREIFSYALRHHAVYIIVIHNHPSGLCEPSAEDIALTKELYESGQMLHIPLLDHIILGDHTYYSFKEEGLVFDQKEQDDD
ncbi:MAG: DNA repair protein RadC [Lachnospiraceae bacterium]|nr:DNA repair protein RadC [Lachnospiraceae bacterium]